MKYRELANLQRQKANSWFPGGREMGVGFLFVVMKMSWGSMLATQHSLVKSLCATKSCPLEMADLVNFK